MATPPTLVTNNSTTYTTSTTPKTTSAVFSPSVGDVLVCLLSDGTDANNENYTFSNSGTNETWVENTETSGTLNSDVFLQTATAVCANAQSNISITCARTAGSADTYGVTGLHFSGSDGPGASGFTPGNGTANGNSMTLTTQQDNSAIVVYCVDFNALSATTRTWATINGYTPTSGNGGEIFYFDGTDVTLGIAVYPDAGALGSKSLSFSTTVAGRWLMAAVEVKGRAIIPPTNLLMCEDDTVLLCEDGLALVL